MTMPNAGIMAYVRVRMQGNGCSARWGGRGGAVGVNQRPTIAHLYVLNTITKFHWRARSGSSILLARARKSEKQAAETPDSVFGGVRARLRRH